MKPKTLPLRATAAALVAAMLASTGGLQAASDTYTGAAGDGIFDNGVNWASGTAPGDITAGVTTNADVATFNVTTGAALTMTAQRNLGGITYGAATGVTVGTFTIGATAGPAFLLSSGGTIIANATSGSQIINAPLVIQNAASATSGTYTIQTDAGSANRIFTLGGAISGAATAGGITTLTLAGGNAAINLVNGIVSDGTAGGKLALVKNGTTSFSFTTGNTFSGGLTVNAGTLRTTSTAASNTIFGTGAITLSGGTISLAATAGSTFNNALVVTGGTQSFIAGRSSNPFQPTSLTGTGNLTFTSTSSAATITPSTFLNFGGTVEVAASGALNTTLRLATAFDQTSLQNANLIIDASQSVTQQGAAGTGVTKAVLIGSLAGAGTIGGSGASTGTFVYTVGSNNASTTFSGLIIGGGSGTALTKVGTGTLTLTGGNSQAGITTINAGTLNINGVNALGGGNYSGLTINGGTLQYATGSGTALPNGSLDISNIGGTAKPVTIAGAATFDTNGNDVTFANTIGNGGIGSVIKAGIGVLTFASANTYSGGTTITGGSIAATINGALSTGNVTLANGVTLTLATGVTDAIADTATLTLGTGAGANATLALNGTNGTTQETVNGLMVNGTPVAAGRYGSTTDTSVPAAFRIPQITGTGELNVLTLAVVPEPSTWVMMLGGLGGLGALVIRRKRCA